MPYVPRTRGPGHIKGFVTPRESASFTFDDFQTTTITLTGAATGSAVYTDSRAGTITLATTATESLLAADSRTGALTLAGTASASQTASDSRSGTVTLAGTAAESFAHVFTDSASGSLTLTGASSEVASAADSATGTIQLSGDGSAVPDTPVFQVVTGGTRTALKQQIREPVAEPDEEELIALVLATSLRRSKRRTLVSIEE